VPKAGDYYAVTIGRQPMIMVRQAPDIGSVQVLYNRCPHRGIKLCANINGMRRRLHCSTTAGASIWTAGFDPAPQGL
jgi:phenylpropionate dioxygenase-like ring-hydroxylating dioxygenase large terminal subunit